MNATPGAIAWVDYNSADPDGTVTALTQYTAPDFREGWVVLTYDGEGNTCEAKVLRIDHALVTLRLHRDTFKVAS